MFSVSESAPASCFGQRGVTAETTEQANTPDAANTVTAEKHKDGNQQRLMECILRTESHFLLDNDPALVPLFLAFVRENLRRTNLCDETGLVRVTLALGEALVTAMVQGYLEIDAELWERDRGAYLRSIDERRRQQPYRDRRVRVIAQELLHEARYSVRHEGSSRASALPDLDHPALLEDARARGLLLIRTCMDEVSHNETGNEITMVKRRDP
jgi:hypothetical protein